MCLYSYLAPGELYLYSNAVYCQMCGKLFRVSEIPTYYDGHGTISGVYGDIFVAKVDLVSCPRCNEPIDKFAEKCSDGEITSDFFSKLGAREVRELL